MEVPSLGVREAWPGCPTSQPCERPSLGRLTPQPLVWTKSSKAEGVRVVPPPPPLLPPQALAFNQVEPEHTAGAHSPRPRQQPQPTSHPVRPPLGDPARNNCGAKGTKSKFQSPSSLLDQPTGRTNPWSRSPVCSHTSQQAAGVGESDEGLRGQGQLQTLHGLTLSL